ncbi:hypothetical protein FCV25MIE_18768 [Fagus crenata]
MVKENLAASGSAERGQGGSVKERTMATKGFASHRVVIPGEKGTVMVAVGCVSHGAVDPKDKEAMVLEVVSGDPKVGTEEVIEASPLRGGT